ncbi:MAG: transposase [Pyrinomonadaceae bacterium]|nr:transposase [Pyrinomonadaceae bacterium]
MKNKEEPKGWYGRGYLPHFDGGEIVQFVTFRLGDSLPKKVIEMWQTELEQDQISEIEYHRKVDKYLDGSYGACWLKDQSIAELVEDTLKFFHDEKYRLIAYVIMPNHVHILIRPSEDQGLASIMHSIKSYTSKEVNKILDRKGKFWSKEYFDRYIRDYDHFIRTVDYIHNNPVRANLVRAAADWLFSSAYHRVS